MPHTQSPVHASTDFAGKVNRAQLSLRLGPSRIASHKAILLANILRERRAEGGLEMEVTPDRVRLVVDGDTFEFASAKGLTSQAWPLREWLNSLA